MNQVLKLLAMVLIGSFALFSCTANRASGPRGISIAGSDAYEATLFRQNCAICHGPEGHGKTANGVKIPSLRIGGPALRSEEEIYRQIAVGKLPMPSFRGQLTEPEMRRMARFIKEEVQGRKGPDK